jgi:hypothetical protein
MTSLVKKFKLDSAKVTASKWILTTYLLAILILVVVIALGLSGKVSLTIAELMQDTSDTANVSPLTGLLSNLGIFLWSATAAICFFSAFTLRALDSRGKFYFLICSAALSTYLLLDDTFLIHEELFPGVTGRSEKILFMMLGLSAIAYLVVFRNLILRTKFSILIAAFSLFGFSLFLDLIPGPWSYWSQDWQYCLEEGAKWLGIVSWCSYYVITAFEYHVSRCNPCKISS